MSKIKNPVLISGIKTRMRSWRSFLLIMIALALLTLISAAAIFSWSYGFGFGYGSEYNNYLTALDSINIGRKLYTALTVVLFALTILIVPGMTSGLIAGEKERQTLDLLLCTPMSGFGIIWGKLFSSLAYFALMLVSALPLFAVVFVFGGLKITSILQTVGYLIVCAMGCGCIGIFCSAICKRTSIATILSYLIVFAFGIGTVVVGVMLTGRYIESLSILGVDLSLSSINLISPVLMINPALGLFIMVNNQMGNPTSDAFNNFNMSGLLNVGESVFANLIPVSSLIFMILMSIVLIIFASVFVKPINKFSFSSKKRSKEKAVKGGI